MYTAKLLPKCQITLPIDVRKALNVKEGDSVVFLPRRAGGFIVANSADGCFILKTTEREKSKRKKRRCFLRHAVDKWRLRKNRKLCQS